MNVGMIYFLVAVIGVVLAAIAYFMKMVMSMEPRAFGAYPTRTFVDAPKMGIAAMVVCGVMLVLVLGWYAALTLAICTLSMSPRPSE